MAIMSSPYVRSHKDRMGRDEKDNTEQKENGPLGQRLCDALGGGLPGISEFRQLEFSKGLVIGVQQPLSLYVLLPMPFDALHEAIKFPDIRSSQALYDGVI